MKQLLFLLLAVTPLASNAQTDPLEKKNDGKLELLHAGKTFSQAAVRKENSPKRLKDDEVYVGDVKFKIGGNQLSCDSAISYTNEDMLSAFHVKITNPESFEIKGGTLSYNKEENTAVLTDSIIVTARNGDIVGTSNNFKLDFSYDIYRLIYGSITPLRK